MKWVLTILGVVLASYTAFGGPSCPTFYRNYTNRALAFELMKSTELDNLTGSKRINPLPPDMTFQEFADGLNAIKDTLFKSTEDFLRWKSQNWSAHTQIGTQGHKLLEIAVAIRMEDKTIKLVPLRMFDKDGVHGSHREMAMMAGEAFGEEAFTYQVRYHSMYHGQIVVSKFAGENFYEYINSGDYDIRVHAQWYLEADKKMPEAWKRLINKVELK